MLMLGDIKESRLSLCVDAAHRFLLSADDAKAIIQGQVDCIYGNWNDACDEAEMTGRSQVLLFNQFDNACHTASVLYVVVDFPVNVFRLNSGW